MSEEIKKIPPAKSLIYGLRCIGYNFSTALADIIDNSISANAKNIFIISDPDYSEPYVAIFDDGYGMGYKDILNAMTLGSDRNNKDDTEIELGRFGLGLKSASFSQCLKLIVASKNCNKINAMQYDLIKIEERNDWILDILSEKEIESLPEINLLKNSKSGTLVIWQDFDKIKNESSKFRDSFMEVIGKAKKHIELVFHRFYNEINFEFNGHKIEKRDPMLEEYNNGQKGRQMSISLDGETIYVTPFILPFMSSLTEEQKKLLGGSKDIYDNQGFYIYRNKRLIIAGGWLHMNVRSEFNKLARVRVDIPSSLDSLWMLDVKKSSAKIPDKIKRQLEIAIKDSVTRSKREVKFPGKKEQEQQHSLWYRLDLHNGNVKYEINRTDNPLYLELKSQFSKDEMKLIDAYLDKVEEFIPKGMIFSDGADSLNIVNSENELEDEKLIEELLTWGKNATDFEYFLDMMLENQAYSKIKDRKNEIIERKKQYE